jgi:hypothetical protein
MCFGSKSSGDASGPADSGPPARQTQIKNPDLFRTPTFEQGKALRRESTASGHSPSHSIREETVRNMSTVSPGHISSEKRRGTVEDEVSPIEGTEAGNGTTAATELSAPTTSPEIQGLKESDALIR